MDDDKGARKNPFDEPMLLDLIVDVASPEELGDDNNFLLLTTAFEVGEKDSEEVLPDFDLDPPLLTPAPVFD